MECDAVFARKRAKHAQSHLNAAKKKLVQQGRLFDKILKHGVKEANVITCSSS
jgi:hypothetical protein